MISEFQSGQVRANQMTNSKPFGKLHRGVSALYALVIMTALIGFCSLGADFGRVEVAKTELRSAADAAARYGAGAITQGVTAVKTRVAAAGLDNKVDGLPLTIDTTNDLEFGTWNAATRTFTVLTGSNEANANAIRVTAKRMQSRGTA